MNFKTNIIEAKYVWMIDIWTYKIRVWICKILNRNVELIWYWEKRQDLNDISLQEIKNIENVCINIKHAVEKAEIDAKIKVKEFIISKQIYRSGTSIGAKHFFWNKYCKLCKTRTWKRNRWWFYVQYFKRYWIKYF